LINKAEYRIVTSVLSKDDDCALEIGLALSELVVIVLRITRVFSSERENTDCCYRDSINIQSFVTRSGFMSVTWE
jgi:hypothetical protein